MRYFFKKIGIALMLSLSIPSLSTAPAQAEPLLDSLGRPNTDILSQMEAYAQNPTTPNAVRDRVQAVVDFFRGTTGGGVALPHTGTHFTQFLLPSLANNCIENAFTATGMAIAVPGPADLPLPGVKPGETTFIFTALGTGVYVPTDTTAMHVRWVNVNTGVNGTTFLTYNGINPEGPATISGTAETGSGTIVALLQGGLNTLASNNSITTCNFTPTGAVFNVA